MVHPPRQLDLLDTVRGLLSCPLIHRPVFRTLSGRCPLVHLLILLLSGLCRLTVSHRVTRYEVHICTPFFRSGGQRNLIRCPSELRCLTRLKNVPIRVEAWVSWWSTPAARSTVLDRSTFTVPGSSQAVQGPGSSQAVQGPGSSQAVQVLVPAKQFKILVPAKQFKVLFPAKQFKVLVPAKQFKILVPVKQFKILVPAKQFKVLVPAKQFRVQFGSQTVFPGGV